MAGYGSATAQLVIETPPADVYVGPRPTPTTPATTTDRRGPRVYGYNRDYRYDDDAVAVRPNGPGGCGTYYYWNGDRCVDARR